MLRDTFKLIYIFPFLVRYRISEEQWGLMQLEIPAETKEEAEHGLESEDLVILKRCKARIHPDNFKERIIFPTALAAAFIGMEYQTFLNQKPVVKAANGKPLYTRARLIAYARAKGETAE